MHKRWATLSPVFLALLLPAASLWGQQPLAFAERVRAQEAIERVYYEHRIWPKENPDPKPPFEEMVPRTLIEKRALAPLQMTAVLKQQWDAELMSADLQAELDRMARESRDPEVLRELFAALGGDPRLICETLVRGALAEREVLRRFESDRAVSRDWRAGTNSAPEVSFEEWLAQVSRRLGSPMRDSEPERYAYRLPDLSISPLAGCDAWSAKLGPQVPPPAARSEHTAVWTGSEMIIWGGYNGASYFNTGGRYTPSTDSWLATSIGTNVPSARKGHTAVWTGTEVIVWGGGGASNSNTGGRYNPTLDTWTSTSVGTGVPTARSGHSAVWTGTLMIIWGGYDTARTLSGSRYSPTGNSWSATSTATNVPVARIGHTAIWTGTVMVVWGGSCDIPYNITNTGGRYNPSNNTWATTSTGTNLPSGRWHHTAVWTGTAMVVFGGDLSPASSPINTGGRYDPTADTWLATSTGGGVPEARTSHSATWTGTQMVVWGGFGSSYLYLNNGGCYTPGTDTWAATSTGANVPAARGYHTAVWSGSEVLLWGGLMGAPRTDFNTGGRYNPTTDTWLPTSLGVNGPSNRQNHTAVWTGSEMIIWGGYNGSYENRGGRYTPATDTWTATSTGANVPTGRQFHKALWTGTVMLVWGGNDGVSDVNTGGRYSPASDTWLPTSTGANVPGGGIQYFTAVWTGSEMIIWGGQQYGSPLSSGARYNPGTDTWLPTSEGTGVPDGRYQHVAVWTGTEMIVWGGSFSEIDYYDMGGRYNPVTNTWSTVPGGVNGRREATAVWSGTEMIIWGGYSWGSYVNTGGRYNPSTNAWLGTSIGANVPTARAGHTAVWTGSEMIVWAGSFYTCVPSCVRTYYNTGARYNPATDTWTATSTGTNLPVTRDQHSAVWAGDKMMVWGGYDPITHYLNHGGIYTTGAPATPGASLLVAKTATVNLGWTAGSGATSYSVKRCSGIPCTPTAVVATPATNSYSEAMDGTSYFYTVEAVNSCGVTP